MRLRRFLLFELQTVLHTRSTTAGGCF